MDTRSGRIFGPEVMAQLYSGRPAETEELIAAREAELAGTLVPVDEPVVQKMRIAEREIERRKRRRKAAREARRRNR